MTIQTLTNKAIGFVCMAAMTLTAISCNKKEDIAVSGISLSQTVAELTEGQTVSLRATVTPSDATDPTVTWSSGNSSVATVSDGLVTAVAPGSTTVSARAGMKTATCSVTVTAKTIDVTSITLDQTKLNLTRGGSYSLKATVLPENATDNSVTWKSSNEDVALVGSNGTVSAVAVGSATITCSSVQNSSVTASCEITVVTDVVDVTGVSLDKTSIDLYVGTSETLKATVSPEDATDKKIYWTSSDESIVTVSDAGVLTGKSAGTASVTVATNSGGKTAHCNVTVHHTKIESIQFTGTCVGSSAYEAANGETFTIYAKVFPEDASNKAISWTISDQSVIKPIEMTWDHLTFTCLDKNAEATITAYSCAYQDVKATQAIRVTVYPSSITLTDCSVLVGKTSPVSKTVVPSIAQASTISWSISDTSIATVDQDGNVTGVAAGTATVTASSKKDSSVEGTATVTVYATNKISINDASAVEYNMGELNKVLSGKTIKKLVWTETSLLNATDVQTLIDFDKSSLEYVDMSKLVIQGGGNYKITFSNGNTSTRNVIDNKLPDYLFYECKSLKHADLPAKLTEIGINAFYKCQLTSVVLPEGLVTIGSMAFAQNALTSITFPSNKVTLGQECFEWNTGLTELDLQNVSATNSAFWACQGLTKVNIGKNSAIGVHTFSLCSKLKNLTIDADNPMFKTQGDYILSKDGKDVYNLIPGYASKDYDAVIPEGVERIVASGVGYFTCRTIKLPSTLTTLSTYSLSHLTIGNNTIRVPVSVTQVGQNSFSYQSGSETVYFESTTPPALDGIIGSGVNLTIYVPKGCLEAYKTAWAKVLASYTTNPPTLKEVED